MLRLGLPFSDCRGQCYDGANVMSGTRNGVAKQLADVSSHYVIISFRLVTW